MQEKRPVPEIEIPPYEPDVVANLHLNHDKIVSGQMPASEQLLMEIRKDLSRLECYPMYKEYTAGTVPTLVMLTESMQRATEDIEQLLEQDKTRNHGEEAEEVKLKNLLMGRVPSIRRNVGAYIQRVIHFHRLKKGYRDNPEDFEKADQNRKRAHESLMQSLMIMTRTVQKAQEQGLLPNKKVIEWVRGMEAKNILSKPDTILVFSDKTLADRDYIKDWAIAADFDSQLQDMLAALPQPQQAAE